MAHVPVNTRRGGKLQILLSPGSVGSTSGFMGVLTLAPGERFGEHYHPYSEEFLYLVRGALLIELDGVAHLLDAEQSVFIPKMVKHRLLNHGTEEAFAVFQLAPLAPAPELGHVDTE